MSAPKPPETADDWLDTAANHRGAAHWLGRTDLLTLTGSWPCGGCGFVASTARELQTHILTAGASAQ